MAKIEFYIPGDKEDCPVKWSDDCEAWIIEGSSITEALTDLDIEMGGYMASLVKKQDLGASALKLAIEALKQVRQNIDFGGYYEQDILKLAEKILKDEYKCNRWNYE